MERSCNMTVTGRPRQYKCCHPLENIRRTGKEMVQREPMIFIFNCVVSIVVMRNFPVTLISRVGILTGAREMSG